MKSQSELSSSISDIEPQEMSDDCNMLCERIYADSAAKSEGTKVWYNFDDQDANILYPTTLIRHKFHDILQKNSKFVTFDYYLAANTLLYVHARNVSLAICECSGSGKTTFLSLMNRMTEDMLSQSYFKLIKEKGKDPNFDPHRLDEILTINIDFRTVFEDQRNNIPGLCKEVQFLIALIKTFVRKIKPFMFDYSSENMKIEGFDVTAGSIEKIILPAEKVKFLAERLARILAFIAKWVAIDNIIKPSEDIICGHEETKRVKTVSGIQVKKVIFLIDEIDILESNNINSFYNVAGKSERNLFIQIMQLAADKDYIQDTYKNVQFIYTSIMPVSKEKHSKLDPIMITDFSDIIIKFNNGKSFGEIDYPKFCEIVNDTQNNLLKELIKNLNDEGACGEYFDSLPKTEDNKIISLVWKEIDKIDKENKVKLTIIEKVYLLFSSLFGQPTYAYKNNLEINKSRYIKDSSSKILCRSLRPKKLNTSYFMSFLMNESLDNGISLVRKYHIETETNMLNFWKLASLLMESEKKGTEDFQMTESEFKIMFKDRIKVLSNSTSNRNQGLYYLYHLGFKNVDGISPEKGKYELDWTNISRKMSFKKGYKESKIKIKKIPDYSKDELIVIEDCFRKEWWDELLKQMKKDFVNVDLKIPKPSDTHSEKQFRIQFEKLIKAAIKRKFLKELPEFNKERLETIVDVKPEKSTNLLEPENETNQVVRPDMIIKMILGSEGGKNFYVIVELKANQKAPINSVQWVTIENKQYDLISHIQDEKHLLLVANLTERKDKNGKWSRKYTFSFATKFIDGNQNHLRRTQGLDQ